MNPTFLASATAYLRTLQRPLDASRLPAPTGKEPLFEYPRGRAPEFTIKSNRFIGVDQVNQALQKHRRVVILDARPESDWMTAHITGAVSIPHYLLNRLDEIPKDAWVITYCACPHHLSGVVVDSLPARRAGRRGRNAVVALLRPQPAAKRAARLARRLRVKPILSWKYPRLHRVTTRPLPSGAASA